MGLIRRIGRCVSAHVVQRRIVAAGYPSRHPDRCTRLTTDHHQCRRMVACRHYSGTIRIGIWYELMSLGSAHRSVMVVLECFVVLLKGCYIFLYSTNRTIGVIEGDPRLISKYHMIPMVIVPVLWTVYKYVSQVVMIRHQSGSLVWMFWAISSHY